MKPYMRWIVALAGLAVIVALFLVFRPGGGGGDASSPGSSPTRGPAPPSASPSSSVPATDAGRIEVTVRNGAVRVTPSAPEVSQGSRVEIVVTSDVADEVHVHGYDLMRDVEAGGTAVIDFVADAPGVFEVELENEGTLLFELTVTP